MKVAYLRVSSTSQSLEVQRDAVSKLNVEKIFEEKVSGTSTIGRDKLRECLDFVRPQNNDALNMILPRKIACKTQNN